MATSAVYNEILKLISSYMDRENAEKVVKHQLAGKNLKAESLATKDLSSVMTAIAGATGLYIPHAGRRDELKAKLKAMA